MTEKLFQFIWRFQYFNRHDLRSTKGEKVEIIHPGTINTNQGPDFLNARIRVDDTLLVGAVELHIRSSEWIAHGHQLDENYKNVVLHVVLENDLVVLNHIPVLELNGRVASFLTSRYQSLMDASGFIACENMIATVKPISWRGWKERLVAERLTRKGREIEDFLRINKYHWEETFWWLLAKTFGGKVNGEAFIEMARTLPVNLLARHKNSIHQLEALLFGQAGLLNTDFEDEYPKLLQREYRFLARKCQLTPINIPVHFLRMRPGNFPTIRLAQLAMLVYQSNHLFSRILEIATVSELKELFHVTANDYWHYHYQPDQPSAFKKKQVGKDMLDNIIINTVAVTLFAYGQHHKMEKYTDKAIEWLSGMEPEANSICTGFSKVGIELANAFDSQAVLELKKNYCDAKLCLQCGVGVALLKNGSTI